MDSMTIIDAAAEFGVDFGKGLTGPDQAPAIQAALDAAYAAKQKGCIVQLPAGQALLASPLVVRGATWLRGHGPAASQMIVWNDQWGTQGPLVTLDSSHSAAMVSDLGLLANIRATQQIDPNMTGIKVAPGTPPIGLGGVVTSVERVIVANVTGYGIDFGSLEGRLTGCYVRTWRGQTNGKACYRIQGSDNFLSGCTADSGGAEGFLIASSNNKLAASKAFGCFGSGFNIGGTRNMFSSCEAQDNGLYGFSDPGGGNMFSACIADTNGRRVATGYGFFSVGNSAASACFAINRDATTQRYGFGGLANVGNPTLKPVYRACVSYRPGSADVDPSAIGSFEVNNVLHGI